eukprot:TRINITY_DN11686_c0_g1_i1.p1 TRINITY_DN11686_c0_g1~~TRINITY_DN11686_c0_g1_i1.p1  ORF type:complete len:124 (-),score=19.86 TRINITY_DN11686_c0_g1_i1:14-385(-)
MCIRDRLDSVQTNFGGIVWEDNLASEPKLVCVRERGQIDPGIDVDQIKSGLAIALAEGRVKEGDDGMEFGGLVGGSGLKGRILKLLSEGEIIAEVEGTAHYSGFNQLILDGKNDPLTEGYLLK